MYLSCSLLTGDGVQGMPEGEFGPKLALLYFENPGLGHASICPDQCAYDTNNSRI